MRDERGVITYEVNIFGSKGPRKMTVLIPKTKTEKEVEVWRPIKSKDGLYDRYQHASYEGMEIYINKDPKWNEQVKQN